MAYKKQTIIHGWLPYRLGGEIGYDYRRTYVLNGHWKIESIKKFVERKSLNPARADHGIWDSSGKGRNDSKRVYDSAEGATQVTSHGLIRI